MRAQGFAANGVPRLRFATRKRRSMRQSSPGFPDDSTTSETRIPWTSNALPWSARA
ncbi:hypothetical protein BGLA2_540007 [Burkholderia gladioli]|nr:hypothetical protein BGLA2_540007 [Burkholderia gladioli]